MNQREKLLGGVVGALLLVVGGYVAISTYGGWVSGLQSEIRGLESTISDKEDKIARGQRAAMRLAALEARSLPNSPEIARSLYKAWLLSLSESDIRLASPVVTPGTISRGAGSYQRLTFTISGEGTLEQLARWLARFYAVDTLHHIRSLRVKPASDERLLQASAAVEALVLDGAAPADAFTPRASQRFSAESADDIVRTIVNRNLFHPANRPPLFAKVSPQRVEADKTLTFRLQASDPDTEDKLTYRIERGAPPGAEISAASGELKFRAREIGDYQISVIVSDSGLPEKSAAQLVAVEVIAPKPVEVVVREPPREPPQPRWDDAKFAFVTAIVEVAGRRQLWLTIRTSGEMLKLEEGDKFTVERLSAVVERIGLTDADIASLGEKRLFKIGDSLAEGSPAL